MNLSQYDLLKQIAEAHPANEAEVETKVVLHLLRLLGYSDADRADKVKVRMHYGRQVVEKIADFILYDGNERSLPNALLTVENKRIGESLAGADQQARSYATWAGTPFILSCNGEYLLAAQFIPGSGIVKSLTIRVAEIASKFGVLRDLIGRTETVLAKERISYISVYLPEIEKLPSADFFREYLIRVCERFQKVRLDVAPLLAPESPEVGLLQVPVTAVRLSGSDDDVGVADFAANLWTGSSYRYVEGSPGSGKSTLCKRVTSALAERSIHERDGAIVPIYIDLAKGIPRTVFAAFCQACTELGVRVFHELYKRSLKEGRIVLLLDGLDELKDTSSSCNEMFSLLADKGVVGGLITSRPRGVTFASEDLTLERFRIRPLTDEELATVLRSHLKNPGMETRLIECSRHGVIPDVRSAMTALMAVRVANELPDWEKLSTFSLYVRYVGILHGYFNAPQIRGPSLNAPVPIKNLLAVLGEAACSCREAQSNGYRLAFGELAESLKAKYGQDATAFLNCGLLTSESGKATFIHRSFEDFGLAHRLVSNFRDHGVEGLLQSHLSDESYRIAASALGTEDEDELLKGVGHNDKHIRKRACGLLSRMPCSLTVQDVLWKRLSVEPSDKVWSTIVRGLFRSHADGFAPWLEAELAHISNRRLSTLAWVIRTSQDARFMKAVLATCELEVPSRNLAFAAFQLALDLDRYEVVDPLVNIYRRLTLSTRLSVIKLIQRKCGSVQNELVRRLVMTERNAKPMIRLLVLSSTDTLKDESMARSIIAALIDDENDKILKKRERRCLREVAGRLKGCGHSSKWIVDLITVCEMRGARVGD